MKKIIFYFVYFLAVLCIMVLPVYFFKWNESYVFGIFGGYILATIFFWGMSEVE